jgi:hypothetical protein
MTSYDKDALNAYRQGKLKDIRRTYKNVQYDSIAVVSLVPGEHTLNVSEGRWQEGGISGGTVSGEQSISFACRPGEILYLVVQLSASEYSRFGSKTLSGESTFTMTCRREHIVSCAMFYRGFLSIIPHHRANLYFFNSYHRPLSNAPDFSSVLKRRMISGK